MTHTPDEIAAMIERLEHMSKNTRDEYLHELAGRSAAMLRDVAAERDALAERIDGLTEDALRFKRLWNTERASLRKRSDEVCGLEYRLGEAETERDRLAAMVEKMRGWVRHDDDCGVNALLMPRPPLTKQCTCGLSEVLKESQDESR